MKLIYCPCKDEEEAETIGQKLVEEKIIACTNIFPMNSCFLWEGETQKSDEAVLLCKTTNEKLFHATQRLKEIHSYKIPAIIVIDATVNKEYEDWMRQTMSNETQN